MEEGDGSAKRGKKRVKSDMRGPMGLFIGKSVAYLRSFIHFPPLYVKSSPVPFVIFSKILSLMKIL